MFKSMVAAVLGVVLVVGFVGCPGMTSEDLRRGGRLAVDVVQLVAQLRGERLDRDEARVVSRGENRERYLRLASALKEGVGYVERNCGRNPLSGETVHISVGGRKAVMTTTCLLEAQLHVEGWYLRRYGVAIREDLDFLSGDAADPGQSDLELFLGLLNGYMEPVTARDGEYATSLSRLIDAVNALGEEVVALKAVGAGAGEGEGE